MTLRETLIDQGRVMYAIMLRDVRSRLFGNGFGFIAFSVGWPLVHIIVLLTIYYFTGRTTPVGDSLVLFFSTGLVPFMTFSYMSRWIMMGVMMNRPLLAFPIVNVMDMVLARALLEMFGSCLMTTTLCFIIWCLGVDFIPHDIDEACFALGAALLLGLGMGTLNAVITLAFHGWFIAYTLVIIGLYVSSGILFLPDALPEFAQYALSFNPVLHAVQWMRSAYYPGYGTALLDKGYLLSWGLCSAFTGFAVERLIRGRLLQG